MSKAVSKREVFKEVFFKGKTKRSNLFSFKYRNDKTKRQALSFVVSSKVYKKAVDRNKLKRRGRYVLSKISKNLNKNLQGAFIAQKGVREANYSDIESDILYLLSESKNLNN